MGCLWVFRGVLGVYMVVYTCITGVRRCTYLGVHRCTYGKCRCIKGCINDDLLKEYNYDRFHVHISVDTLCSR